MSSRKSFFIRTNLVKILIYHVSSFFKVGILIIHLPTYQHEHSLAVKISTSLLEIKASSSMSTYFSGKKGCFTLEQGKERLKINDPELRLLWLSKWISSFCSVNKKSLQSLLNKGKDSTQEELDWSKTIKSKWISYFTRNQAGRKEREAHEPLQLLVERLLSCTWTYRIPSLFY